MRIATGRAGPCRFARTRRISRAACSRGGGGAGVAWACPLSQNNLPALFKARIAPCGRRPESEDNRHLVADAHLDLARTLLLRGTNRAGDVCLSYCGWAPRHFRCHSATTSSARASGPEVEPSPLRIRARRKVSNGQPCWRSTETATAASRAFTSTAVPCFAVLRRPWPDSI